MMRGPDATSQRFLAALDRLDRTLQRVERQISSGRRLGSPADAPDDVSPALVLRARHAATAQTLRNLQRVKTEVDSAESAISGVVASLDKAISVGTQGATDTQTVAGRSWMANQIQAILEQTLSASALSVAGRFVFSGDRDGVAPYQLDLTQPNGVTAYQGSAATREIAHPSGERFAASRTAQQLLDAPGASVFGALNRLRVALLNGPAEGSPTYTADFAAQSAEIAAAVADLKTAQQHLGGELSGFGALQQRVEQAIDFAQKEELRQKTELSALEDTDLASAIVELQSATVHREAALGVRSRMPQGSLFDYLK